MHARFAALQSPCNSDWRLEMQKVGRKSVQTLIARICIRQTTDGNNATGISPFALNVDFAKCLKRLDCLSSRQLALAA